MLALTQFRQLYTLLRVLTVVAACSGCCELFLEPDAPGRYLQISANPSGIFCFSQVRRQSLRLVPEFDPCETSR